jgi:hypothetical protein
MLRNSSKFRPESSIAGASEMRKSAVKIMLKLGGQEAKVSVCILVLDIEAFNRLLK